MITTKEAARLIKEARASSQTKCHFDNCPALANTCEAHATGLWKVSEKEAYANGVREGQRSKTAFKMGVESVTKTCSDCQKVQRKIGRDELIEKVKKEGEL